MTKIIFIVATQLEANYIEEALMGKFPVVVSGMGNLSTSISTINAIKEHSPELVVGVGIAGAVDKTLELGDVVQVTSDYEADLGAYRKENSPSFQKFRTQKFQSTKIINNIKQVSGRTVTIACNPMIEDQSQVESMEGVAVMVAAKSCNVDSIQIRSISNYIDQPRSEWQVEKALKNLREFIANNF